MVQCKNEWMSFCTKARCKVIWFQSKWHSIWVFKIKIMVKGNITLLWNSSTEFVICIAIFSLSWQKLNIHFSWNEYSNLSVSEHFTSTKWVLVCYSITTWKIVLNYKKWRIQGIQWPQKLLKYISLWSTDQSIAMASS